MDRAKRRVILDFPTPLPISESELALLEMHLARLIGEMDHDIDASKDGPESAPGAAPACP